jgi:hypothetical protein
MEGSYPLGFGSCNTHHQTFFALFSRYVSLENLALRLASRVSLATLLPAIMHTVILSEVNDQYDFFNFCMLLVLFFYSNIYW